MFDKFKDKVQNFFHKKDEKDKKVEAVPVEQAPVVEEKSYMDMIDDPQGVVEEFMFSLPKSYVSLATLRSDGSGKKESSLAEEDEESELLESPPKTAPNYQVHSLKTKKIGELHKLKNEIQTGWSRQELLGDVDLQHEKHEQKVEEKQPMEWNEKFKTSFTEFKHSMS